MSCTSENANLCCSNIMLESVFKPYMLKFLCTSLVDAVKQNESWDTRGKVDSNLEIPLLMQNKVPDGFETDDHLDVSLRPDEVGNLMLSLVAGFCKVYSNCRGSFCAFIYDYTKEDFTD